LKRSEYNKAVHQHADQLFGYAIRFLRNREDARDVVQDVFEKLWIHRKKVELPQAKAWGGFNFLVYRLTFGGAISSKLDPAVSAGIKLKYLILQYNLDLTHSSMLNKQVFSHQFTLRFTTKTRHIGRPILN
jgi:hypothetical protein